jgi:3D (Asp-Asp-Asp) domain-containing protein
MKRLIILAEIVILAVLLYFPFAVPKAEAVKEPKHYMMTVTAYSKHPNCISSKYNDGLTATMTPVREGVAAINVDRIGNRWYIKSPLDLGDKIYIEGLGNYSVEDTGYFTDIDYKQDYWNVDIYIEDYNEAVKFGRQLRKVYVIEGGEK